MTSGNVNNFVSDLVLMAKAMEELPGVRNELEHAHTQVEEYAKQVQRLEMSLIDRKHEIEALYAKVHAVEAERDDAELRFLDADDKAHKVTGILRAALGEVGDAVVILDPPKPEPVPEPTPPAPTQAEYDSAQVAMGQSDYTPTKPSSTSDGGQTIGSTDNQHPFEGSGGGLSQPLPVTSFEEVPKSDANPTPVLDTSTMGEATGSSPSPEAGQASQSSDDVGYHNEPDVGTDWSAWNVWCERMRLRYGAGAWPQRPDNAAPSVA